MVFCERFPSVFRCAILGGTVGLMGLGGCTPGPPTKTLECESLLAIAHDVQSQTKAMGTQDGEPWQKMSPIFTTASEDLKKLTPTDPQIQTYRDDLARVYHDYGQANEEMVRARREKNRTLASQAQTRVQAAGDRELTLSAAINQYCGTEETP